MEIYTLELIICYSERRHDEVKFDDPISII